MRIQNGFLLLSYSFGIETINTFIHSRSSLENHTRFQNKLGQVYTSFYYYYYYYYYYHYYYYYNIRLGYMPYIYHRGHL